MLLVTGGAGFIGSNFVLSTLAQTGEPLVNLDKLGYAGNLDNLKALDGDARHVFVRGDIADRELVRRLLAQHKPRAIVHFAAESHVDRSIHGPGEFVQSNIVGTWALLEEAREYAKAAGAGFRFLHVSTDEVFGSLGEKDPAFTEQSNYAPNSPYSASKAAADHLVRAYHHTYGLATLVTNCSNNYGPYQLPEKLIPLLIHNALQGKPLPIYGDGLNVRDWLYVDDHADALLLAVERGRPGETYNVGSAFEASIEEVADAVLELTGKPDSLKTIVPDRPGHDRRYLLSSEKLRGELGWRPQREFRAGLEDTVEWYREHRDWWEPLKARAPVEETAWT